MKEIIFAVWIILICAGICGCGRKEQDPAGISGGNDQSSGGAETEYVGMPTDVSAEEETSDLKNNDKSSIWC